MTDQPAALVLDSVGSFFQALRSSDPALLVGVLRAVASNPEAALAFGRVDGRDVVDELIFQSQQREGVTLQQLLLGTLASFRDERIPDRMLKALMVATDPQIIQIATDRLSWEPTSSYAPAVRSLLLQTNSKLHVFAAADLLIDDPDLSERQRIRVTVANTTHSDIGPPLNHETCSEWLEELGGEFAAQARMVLGEREEQVVERLGQHWKQLTEETRVWLLDIGCRREIVAVTMLLPRAFEDPNDSLVLAGLAALDDLVELDHAVKPGLTSLLTHGNWRVRALAVRHGAGCSDWGLFIEQEEQPEVIAAAANRLALEKPAGALAHLLPLLDSSDYRLRAAGASALSLVGSSAIEPLRDRVKHGSATAIAAAVQALTELGDYEWLETHLLQ